MSVCIRFLTKNQKGEILPQLKHEMTIKLIRPRPEITTRTQQATAIHDIAIGSDFPRDRHAKYTRVAHCDELLLLVHCLQVKIRVANGISATINPSVLVKQQ
jgi:hypothetical protein